MEIRLTGTAEECAAAAELISQVLDVLGESAPYASRASARLVRVYVTARVLAETDQKGDEQ